MTPYQCLVRHPLFALLKPQQIESWLANGEELDFATGETVFREGTSGIWMYLILEGMVRVMRRNKEGKDLSLGTFSPGELFGEYAILPPGKNTATCRVSRDARLLRLPLLPIKPLFNAIPTIRKHLKKWMRLHSLRNYLRDSTFLGFMSAPSALWYLDHVQPVHFDSLRTIQADGLSPDRWYFIEEGQVSLHVPGETVPRDLGPGDSFGEHALAAHKPLPEAVALSEVRCLTLQYESFLGESPGRDSANHPSIQTHLSNCLHRPQVWIGQREKSDCGPAALAMIAQFYGKRISIEDIRGQVHLSDQGISMMEMVRLAQHFEMPCHAVRVSAEQLPDVLMPAVAHQQDGHYVVLYHASESGVEIGDPATGVVKVSLDFFRKVFSGRLLLFAAMT